MRTGSQPVKMRVNKESKVVGTATYFVYEAITEAVDGLGEEKCLELLNAQVRTNEMNKVRQNVRGGPSKKALELEAMRRITSEQWQSVAGDPDKIQRLLDETVAVIKAEKEAEIGTSEEEEEEEEGAEAPAQA